MYTIIFMIFLFEKKQILKKSSLKSLVLLAFLKNCIFCIQLYPALGYKFERLSVGIQHF